MIFLVAFVRFPVFERGSPLVLSLSLWECFRIYMTSCDVDVLRSCGRGNLQMYSLVLPPYHLPTVLCKVYRHLNVVVVLHWSRAYVSMAMLLDRCDVE